MTSPTEYERRARAEAFLEPVRLGAEIDMKKMVARDALVREFSWAIPNEPALKAIAQRGPVVELGAGGGYWAYELRKRGVDVVAYEPELWYVEPTGYREEVTEADGEKRLTAVPEYERRAPKVWTEVLLGDHTAVERHPDRALLLVWPTYKDPFAADALELYRGDTVIYVGEWGGCTADKRFHDLLDAGFEREVEVAIPQFYGIHDHLSVWRRRG